MTLVDDIEKVRSFNNKLWMDILRLALASSPDEAKAILNQINANDKKISELLGRLAT